MKFESKYAIGDIVYFTEAGKTLFGKVVEISTRGDGIGYSISLNSYACIIRYKLESELFQPEEK